MNTVSREELSSLLKTQRIKSRLARELRFIPEEVHNWDDLEMLAVSTRSNAEGVLLVQTDDFFMLPYERATGLKDKVTGRSKPVTCDFCYTWQQGGKAGRITFRRKSDDHTFTYLCCADLRCSLHVRGLTAESMLSRTQLHENLTNERRIARLKENLNAIITMLSYQPVVL